MNKTVKLFAVALLFIASTSLVQAMNNNNNNNIENNNDKASNIPNNETIKNMAQKDWIERIRKTNTLDDLNELLNAYNRNALVGMSPFKDHESQVINLAFEFRRNELSIRMDDLSSNSCESKSVAPKKWKQCSWGYKSVLVLSVCILGFYGLKKLYDKVRRNKKNNDNLAR